MGLCICQTSRRGKITRYEENAKRVKFKELTRCRGILQILEGMD